MTIKRIIFAFIALIAVSVGLLIFFSKNKKTPSKLPEPTPTVEQQIKNKFNGLVIPDDADKIELKNVSGGEGIGIATKNEILADLPDLAKGENYSVFISNGSRTYFLGNLRQAKGGYLLNYDLTKFPGYNQIFVSEGGKHILEGNF